MSGTGASGSRNGLPARPSGSRFRIAGGRKYFPGQPNFFLLKGSEPPNLDDFYSAYNDYCPGLDDYHTSYND